MERIAQFARIQLMQAVDDLIESLAGAEVLAKARSADAARSTEGIDVEHRRFRHVAEALTQWHSNDTFLARDGSPRPLPKTGKPSLMSLARQIAETAPKAQAVVSDLIEFGLVEESAGLYRPARRSAVLGRANALNLAYAAITATRLLRTIRHNVTGRAPRLYERQVSDVTIRAVDLPVYLRFVDEQAQYLIDSADDWLSRRRVGRSAADDQVTVGLGAFAWTDVATGIPARRVRRSSRGTRSPK